MMNLRDKYKVIKKTESVRNQTEEAYKRQEALLADPEYKSRVNKSMVDLVRLFYDKYPKANLDTPIARGKSLLSLEHKIYKQQIERLCIIYALRELTKDEKEELVRLMKVKAENSEYNNDIEKVMNDSITDTSLIDSVMEKKDLNDYVRMALLRITRVKISREVEDLDKREDLIEILDEKYGQKAAERSGRLPDNIMHWENVKKAVNSEIEREKINNPKEYLKAKDLRAFRIVISKVNDDIETDNEELKKCIEERKKSKSNSSNILTDKCNKALEKDFCDFIANNEKLLETMNLKLVYRKEKNKQNGYYADHLKFCYLDKPDYTFEMQVRSMYVDDISRYNGPAGHMKRADKDRVFPDTSSKETFISQLRRSTPQYSILIRNGKQLFTRECTDRENMDAYFLGYVDQDSEEYKKAIEYLLELENEKNTDAR